MRTLQLQKPTLVVSLLNWPQINNYAKVWPLCWVPTEKSDTRSKPWQQTKQTKHKWRQKQQKQQTNKQTNGLAFWNSENKMWVTGFQREHYTHICSTYNTIYFEEDSHLINMVLDLLLRRIHIGSDDPDVGISSRNLQNKKMKTSRTNPLLLLDRVKRALWWMRQDVLCAQFVWQFNSTFPRVEYRLWALTRKSIRQIKCCENLKPPSY